MWTPPDDITVGDRLSQADIEDAFATGFGYRISGINPRRDANDNRYVLLFATEDGPYDDAVTAGRFTYIGEGLDGDQDPTSPGNAVLIDAATTDLPIHFFYQRAGETTWEYQGLVTVRDYEIERRDGREVIVYTMEHRDRTAIAGNQSPSEISWRDAVRRELERYREQTGATMLTLDEVYAFAEHRLATLFPDNDHVRAKIRQQLQFLRDEGELEFVDDQGTYRLTEGIDVQQAHTELQDALESEPQLTEDTTMWNEQRRRARRQAFREEVITVYDRACGICGSRRETPTGQAEVEAAHIYPKREGGADDLRNGIALCKLHHWAFDTGWVSIADDYTLLVADTPDRTGYDDFQPCADELIRLPDDNRVRPHPVFLQGHRALYGF